MNPQDRPRRLRSTPVLREMLAETQVAAQHLITPHFVVGGQGIQHEIGSMPGVNHVSVDKLVAEIGADLELGLKSHLLFGVPENDSKDEHGSSALDENGPVAEALQELKTKFAALGLAPMII